MDSSFLDLLGGSNSMPKKVAPVEIMSEFLVLVSENKMEQALEFTDRILEYEPNNKLIQDYKKALKALVIQQREESKEAEEEDSSSEEEEEEDDEDEDEDGEEEMNDSDHSDSQEVKKQPNNVTKSKSSPSRPRAAVYN